MVSDGLIKCPQALAFPSVRDRQWGNGSLSRWNHLGAAYFALLLRSQWSTWPTFGPRDVSGMEHAPGPCYGDGNLGKLTRTVEVDEAHIYVRSIS
jgi:hypothetical protein